MLKLLREDFIYGLVNNTGFTLLSIAVSIYLCLSVHTLSRENVSLNRQIVAISANVENIQKEQSQFTMRMDMHLSAESVVLAKMADEVKAQSESLQQAQLDNERMIKQLKALKHELRILERRH